jgi:hypothetical protein
MPLSPLCFWHPVGPHEGESLEEIVRRKQGRRSRRTVTRSGRSRRRPRRGVEAWRRELRGRALATCNAVCCGDASVDPHDGTAPARWMTQSSEDARTWTPIPRMTNYHRGPRPQRDRGERLRCREHRGARGCERCQAVAWLRAKRAGGRTAPCRRAGSISSKRLCTLATSARCASCSPCEILRVVASIGGGDAVMATAATDLPNRRVVSRRLRSGNVLDVNYSP